MQTQKSNVSGSGAGSPHLSNKPNGHAITAAEIIDGLGGSPNSGMCCCPAHDDQNASLHVSENPDGLPLVHCHAGCSQEAVIEALRNRGLWPERSYQKPAQPAINIDDIRRQAEQRFPGDAVDSDSRPKRKIAAVYDYKSENGQLLYQTVRYEPKDFRQRRPNGSGGWIWNLKGVRPVPYHLPRVLKANRVYIVEGEKDVQTMEKSLRRAATCNPMGAGKWHDEFSEHLKDKEVVIIPDSDAPGQTHAEQVARSVSAAGAKWVKIVTLPGEGVKDVSDWVEAGGTTEQLVGLVKSARLYQPPITSIADVPSIFTYQNQEIAFDLEGILISAGVTGITGEAGSGKSTLITALCEAVSRGAEFAGLVTRKRPVLILDRENPLAVVVDRFERLRIRDTAVFKVWGGWGLEDVPDPRSDLIVRYVKQSDPKPLVVFDSLMAFHGGDENNATEMHAVMVQFRQLANLGATVLVLHNSSEKTDSAKNYRGSSAFKQDLDVGYLVTNSTTDTLLGTLRLEAFKTRVRVEPEIYFEYKAGRFAVDRKQTPVAAASTLKDYLIAHPGITLSDFEEDARRLGLGRNAARLFLRRGIKSSVIEVKKGPHQKHLHTWVGDANS